MRGRRRKSIQTRSEVEAATCSLRSTSWQLALARPALAPARRKMQDGDRQGLRYLSRARPAGPMPARRHLESPARVHARVQTCRHRCLAPDVVSVVMKAATEEVDNVTEPTCISRSAAKAHPAPSFMLHEALKVRIAASALAGRPPNPSIWHGAHAHQTAGDLWSPATQADGPPLLGSASRGSARDAWPTHRHALRQYHLTCITPKLTHPFAIPLAHASPKNLATRRCTCMSAAGAFSVGTFAWSSICHHKGHRIPVKPSPSGPRTPRHGPTYESEHTMTLYLPAVVEIWLWLHEHHATQQEATWPKLKQAWPTPPSQARR